MSPFKSAGASVQSTTGNRGVRISDSNVGYSTFRGTVKSTSYPLHSPVSPSLPRPASPCAITFQLDSTNNSQSQFHSNSKYSKHPFIEMLEIIVEIRQKIKPMYIKGMQTEIVCILHLLLHLSEENRLRRLLPILLLFFFIVSYTSHILISALLEPVIFCLPKNFL